MTFYSDDSTGSRDPINRHGLSCEQFSGALDGTLNDLRDIPTSSLLGSVTYEAAVVVEAWGSREVVMITMETKDTQRVNT